MALGLQNALGTQNLSDTIRQILATRKAEDLAKAADEYKRQQDAIKNALASRTIAVDEGGLTLNRDKFNADAPIRAANVADVQSQTAARLQDTAFKGDDRSRAIGNLDLLSDTPVSPGRLSPRAITGLKMFNGVDFTTPGGERAIVAPTTLGAEQGSTARAMWEGGGRQQFADESRITADNQIRVANAKAGAAGGGASSTAVDEMLDKALATAQKLKTMRGKSGAVGARGLAAIPEYFGGKPLPGTDEADFAREAQTLVSQISLPNLSMMKGMGALSDAEGKRIEAASTSLSRDMSEPQWDAELDNVIATLQGAQARRRGGAMAPAPSHATSTTQPAASSIDVVRGPNGQLMRR